MDAKLGKIDHHLFDSFIKDRCGALNDRVTTPPGFGVDVSVVDINAELAMALTSDPLSLIPSLGLQESAWLSVHLMANDMATTGWAPQFGQFVLNLPATFSKEDFQQYWNYIHQYCQEIGVAITGGHTGFIEGQNSTIAGGGTFVTLAPKSKILVSTRAQEGDRILLTKSAALTASAILALSFPDTVTQQLGRDVYSAGAEAFYQTSSLTEALKASKIEGGVSAMHDVTEGGLLGAIYELCVASNKGCQIYHEKLPVQPAQQAICQLFDIDPFYCVGAGSMVMTCRPEKVVEVIQAINEAGISCVEVGEIISQAGGKNLVDSNGELNPMSYYADDPYWAAFFTALKKGWK